jgi:hypothetical protein
MHGRHHEQWKRERVPGFQRLQWERDVPVTLDRRSCPCCIDPTRHKERASDTLHVGYQQEVQEFQQALERKRDGRPFLCKACRVSFYGPKEGPICCERCVSAARLLPGWLFGGCKTVDETPDAYDDTTPPPITRQETTRDTTPRPWLCPSVDTSISSTSSASAPPVRYENKYMK